MIKVETVGMIQNSHVEPTLTSANDVKNYSFITVDGVPYLVANDITGDNAYVEDVTIAAGEYLNGWDLTKWENQKLVIDAKHFSNDYASVAKGDTLTIKADYLKDGGLGDASLVVSEKTTLTGPAVKAVITFGE